MKKYYFILCLAFVFFGSQHVIAQKLQSTILETWNLNTNTWKNWEKKTYTYDSNTYLVSVLTQHWYNSIWENAALTTYTNDIAGSALVTLNQTWTAAGVWNNSKKTTTTYIANKQLEIIHESWYANAWQQWEKYNFTYDNNLHLLSQAQQSWGIGSWINNNLYSFTNDTAGNSTQMIEQDWISAAGTWSNASSTAVTYTANKPLVLFNGRWDGSAWQARLKRTHTYDNNLNELSHLDQGWNNASWNDHSLWTYTNDAIGNPTLTLYQLYAGSSGWVNIERTSSTYVDLSSAIAIQGLGTSEDLKAFPVPANGVLHVQLEIEETYTISNMDGKAILTATLARDNNAINVSSLAPGIYFLKSANGKTAKIIKQ